MTEQELKKELNSYYSIKQLIRALERSEEEHKEFISRCTSSGMELNSDEFSMYSNKLQEAYKAALKCKVTIQQYIERLSEYPELRAALYARYINNESPSNMEETLMCSRRTVDRRKKKAIEILLQDINR